MNREVHPIHLPDVGFLGTKYCTLFNSDKAECVLSQMADQIRLYDRYLDQYPTVMVEHLEYVYELAKAIAALNTDFLTMQLHALGWRGVISGGLYCLIGGRPAFAKHFENVQPTHYPENMWSCDCAIAFLTNTAWPREHKSLEAPIEIIRDGVKRLKVPPPPLRRGLTSDEFLKFDQFRTKMRQQYQKSGADGAKQWMQQQPEHQWVVSYPHWLRDYASDVNCLSRYQSK